MAFQQTTRPALQGQNAVPAAVDDHDLHLQTRTLPPPDESQTWVLFSPASAATTTSAASTLSDEDNVDEEDDHRSLETPGRSRLSDLGSLDTVARSEGDSLRRSAVLSAAINDDDDDEEAVEDDLELDSLDSHLPDFRTNPSLYNQSLAAAAAVALPSAPVRLPTHDGLGSFRLDRAAGGTPEVQDHIYAFERFNPRRVRRRTESFERARLELGAEEVQELEKLQRIEAWRLEQSRILLEEVQRETRRRRLSQSSARPQAAAAPQPAKQEALPGNTTIAGSKEVDEMDWHSEADTSGEPEGFWSRMTRKVIRELLGIDDRLLSLLLGESLPDEEELSSTPRASAGPLGTPQEADSPWTVHLLERVAKELGHLVNHLSHHPGAFSAYTRMQQMPLPYAGLPAIPESTIDASAAGLSPAGGVVDGEYSMSTPEFRPTIGSTHAATQPMAIPGQRQRDGVAQLGGGGTALAAGGRDEATTAGHAGNNTGTFTQDEWEQDLDIKLVFRYLRSRFTSRGGNSSSSTGGAGGAPFTTVGTSHLATSSTADTAAKAARVRAHHPLVARMHLRGGSTTAERRPSFKATSAGPSSAGVVGLGLGAVALRHASSCASQSTRRSARRSSVSSRHYWDIGGSVGTAGSVIAPTGPMGSWGEV